jgi:hypothetical protein
VDGNIGGSFVLGPISDGGTGLAIEIAPGETIWITLRADSGFDSALPGHGIIIEHSDDNNGNAPDNLVNTDPENAWVKIIEADGDDALQRSRDSGSAGDVFSVGDEFGADGMMIRDNRGRLVTWSATVVTISPESATVEIEPKGESSVEVLTPRGPIQFLSGELTYARVTASQACTLEVSLSTTQSESQVQPEYIDIPLGTYDIEILGNPNSTSDSGSVRGTIGCEGEVKTNIDLDWFLIGHRLSTEELYVVVPWESSSSVELMPEYEGEEERTYSIAVEGAAARIATTSTPISLSPGDSIILDIEPDGLLEPGMIARGNLVLSDSHGSELRIPLLLEAESPFTGDGWVAWLAEPSNGLLVISVLLAISIVSGGRSQVQQPPKST